MSRDNTRVIRLSMPSLSRLRVAQKLAAPLVVLVITAAVYGLIYFREDSLPAGIGANLVPAERVLKGEVPYKDFYKIQTPGILLLNAGLFKLWGTSLLTALRGVLIFKVLTVVMVFIVARLVVPSAVALVPTLLSMVWLPPGGPFRPAPIQYEMFFILTAVYFVLRWLDSERATHAFAAGVAVGLVALFKQNVGLYCALALAASIIAGGRWLKSRAGDAAQPRVSSRLALTAAAAGASLPLVGLLAYLVSNGALKAALRVFIEGPGEHIQMKFTGYPLPKYALLIFSAGALVMMGAAFLAEKAPQLRRPVFLLLFAGAGVSAALVPQAAIDNSLYWFAPALFLFSFWFYMRRKGHQGEGGERVVLLVLLLFSMASFAEVFPRSVRGLIIGTLPPAFVLLAFLCHTRGACDKRVISSEISIIRRRLPVFATVSIVFMVFALRMVLPDYFHFEAGRGLRFKADSELSFDRGRDIYFPAEKAAEIDRTVEFIRSRVEEGGFFFAHSLDGASYYFLADRSSPTGATLWNDAGTTDAERERTMTMLRQKEVRLVLTSEQALAEERYVPLLDYLASDFHEAARIGRGLFLERNF